MRHWLNVYQMFVRHPQRHAVPTSILCQRFVSILCQRNNASRLPPVGWIDVQLIMYLLPAQIKREFIAYKVSNFFLKLLASKVDCHTNKCVVRPQPDINSSLTDFPPLCY